MQLDVTWLRELHEKTIFFQVKQSKSNLNLKYLKFTKYYLHVHLNADHNCILRAFSLSLELCEVFISSQFQEC